MAKHRSDVSESVEEQNSADAAASEKQSETAQNGGSGLSDFARRLFVAGLGAVFVTEESIRLALGELKMPKEFVSYLFEQAKRQKDELRSSLGKEVLNFLSKIKIHEELRKLLETVDIKIETKISFEPKKTKPDAES